MTEGFLCSLWIIQTRAVCLSASFPSPALPPLPQNGAWFGGKKRKASLWRIQGVFSLCLGSYLRFILIFYICLHELVFTRGVGNPSCFSCCPFLLLKSVSAQPERKYRNIFPKQRWRQGVRSKFTFWVTHWVGPQPAAAETLPLLHPKGHF